MFIFSFCSRSLVWVPVSFPSLLVPCMFFFISFYIAFTSSSILQSYPTISVSILITSVLNSASDISSPKRLSPLCLVLFLEFWSVLSFGLHFFDSAHLLCCKGQRLRYAQVFTAGIHQGRATQVTALWHCMWGRIQHRKVEEGMRESSKEADFTLAGGQVFCLDD